MYYCCTMSKCCVVGHVTRSLKPEIKNACGEKNNIIHIPWRPHDVEQCQSNAKSLSQQEKNAAVWHEDINKYHRSLYITPGMNQKPVSNRKQGSAGFFLIRRRGIQDGG